MSLRATLYRYRARLFRREVSLWYDPAYRLPISGLDYSVGMEPRRADYVAWWLRKCQAVSQKSFRTPNLIDQSDLVRVHTPELVASLGKPETLANIFGVDTSDVPVDELLRTIRLAAGATVQAARETLRTRAPALNLFGGFHHASPAGAGGFCPVNDIAIAVAVLRADGFTRRVVILDLDAHPPDGIAACLAKDPHHWIGSISGSNWGLLEGVDETVLPESSGDEVYLEALRALLGRMPRAHLCFVIAGGDVLAGDRLGKLGLSLQGARRRDLLVAAKLRHLPTVWLPGGGYSRLSWRLLAGTAMAVATGSREPIPDSYDPLSERFAGISAEMELAASKNAAEIALTTEDIEESLGMRPQRQKRMLGFYTGADIDTALFRYGIYEQLRRLGFSAFRVAIDAAGPGERLCVFGSAQEKEHLLVEVVVEKRRLLDVDVLYIHWLLLRNPRAQFSELRPRLPGQDSPGLGLARETGEMLGRMAVRLRLRGLVFRPAHYHTALFFGRNQFAFLDSARQGRFEALVRDLKGMRLVDATNAVTQGSVKMNGALYRWEADEMARWLRRMPVDEHVIVAERERVRFTL